MPRLPAVPRRGITLERILWHPFDILIATFLSTGLVYWIIASIGFDPLSFPPTGLFMGIGAGLIASSYYQLVWGDTCRFCKNLTPTETGRCAICLAPLGADPSKVKWKPAPDQPPLPRPGPHGDRGWMARSFMLWRDNKRILAREAGFFFVEVLFIGLYFEEAFYFASLPPTGRPDVPLFYFLAAFGMGILRPSMHRFGRRVVRSWKATRPKVGRKQEAYLEQEAPLDFLPFRPL